MPIQQSLPLNFSFLAENSNFSEKLQWRGVEIFQ